MLLAPTQVGRGETLSSWSVVKTAHFRVFHHQSPSLAGKVGQAAEQARSALCQKWFDPKEYRPWEYYCDIYLHESRAAYQEMTGTLPPGPAHCTIRDEGERGIFRRIDVQIDAPNMLTAVLPHEVGHASLAGQFDAIRVPPWVDEGVAVLAEPPERAAAHLRCLPQFRQEGHLFRARQLMELPTYPEESWVGPFYAQSVSLVSLLTREKGPVIFTRFVRDAVRGGYRQALKRHYGWDFGDLERRVASDEWQVARKE